MADTRPGGKRRDVHGGTGKPAAKTVSEPARETPVIASADVLVVGGGAAGVSAAVAAAREGAHVILAERYGSLGGLATGGLIILLLTLDDGAGRQVIGGICQEIVDRMHALGGAFAPPRAEWGSGDPARIERYRRWGLVWGSGKDGHRVRYSVAYDPEILREVLQRTAEEAGVELFLHQWAAEALLDGGRVRGCAFQSKAGRGAILADVVIDASGDGDVFASAGCDFDLEPVHAWLWLRVGGVDDVEGVLDREPWIFRTVHRGQLLLPWGSMGKLERKIDATNPRDLSYAETACRRAVMEEFRRLQSEIPAMRNAHVCNIATQLGITESRRLHGAHILTHDEMNKGFDDAVAVTGHWTKYGAVYAIPYRCLRASGIANLLAAGRNISVDHRAHHATKEIPACMATGQAAGVAAAMALSEQATVAHVDVTELRRRLHARGAIVDYPFGQA